MKITFVPMIVVWIFTPSIPSISKAVDWSGLTPKAVCSYLDWSDAKKIMLVGGGKNLPDVTAAVEALQKNLQDCPKVSLMITAQAMGDVSTLDDAAIVAKATKMPIDLVLVVRVFPDSGRSSLTATFYDKKGETVSAFLADTRTALVAKSIKQPTAITTNQPQSEAATLKSPDAKKEAQARHQEFRKKSAPKCIQPRHDGFFLRLSFMGLGYGHFNREDNLKLKGLSSSFEVAVGYAAIENLIFHFGVGGPILMEPTLSSPEISDKREVMSVGSGGILGGLTYYFMPHNIYLTAAVGLASMDNISLDGQTIGKNKKGISTQFSVGKEWWTTKNWGIGVAGALFVQSIEDNHNGLNWTNVAGGVLFSATYN